MKHNRLFVWLLLALVPGLTATAGERTQSFPAKKGGMLEVHVDGGAISVRGWDKNEVFVRVQSLDEEQLKRVAMSQAGDKVRVEFRSDRGNVEDMQFEISVPSLFNVDLQTSGGDLTLQPPLSGDLKGVTAGGSIRLGELAGTIRMQSAGGEITAGDISGDLTVQTAGGDISLKNVSGAAVISTAGGAISVGDVGKTLHAMTAGGEIAIGKVNGDLSASTAGGNIKVKSGQDNIKLNTSGGNIELTTGRGNASASTSGGNISFPSFDGSVEASTSAGDINVMLKPSAGGSSSLATSAGNIVLTVPPDARVTISARTSGPTFGEKEESQIRSDYPLKYPEKGRSGGRGEVVLNGGGHRITLETMIGKIDIRKPR